MLEDCLYAISGREMTTVQPARIYQALSSICLCSPQFCFPAKHVSILNLKLTNNIIIVILSYSIWEQKRERVVIFMFSGGKQDLKANCHPSGNEGEFVTVYNLLMLYLLAYSSVQYESGINYEELIY